MRSDRSRAYTEGNREIGLTLDLAKNARSERIASMSVASENAKGLVASDVAVNGNSVKFVGVELMMAKFGSCPWALTEG
jgi:hypothetical protein